MVVCRSVGQTATVDRGITLFDFAAVASPAARDVNFVFFQKPILVLKKSIFFDYRISVLFAVDRRYVSK